MKKLIPWKTITLGKEVSLDKDIYVSCWAKDLISNFTPSKKKEEIDLVILTPRELGFMEIPTTQELFNSTFLEKHGLELCPPDVGPLLWQICTDQPNNDWLYIAMNPIIDSGGYPSVFGVGCGAGGRWWLDGRWAHPTDRWFLGSVVVFRLRNVSLDSESQSLSVSRSDTRSFESFAETSVEARLKEVEQFLRDNFKGFHV